MNKRLAEVLRELVDEYGTEILNDPDRLAQFLEGRDSIVGADENFRFVFALHSIIRAGWTAETEFNSTRKDLYLKRLTDEVAFTEEDAKNFLDTLECVVYADGEDAVHDAVVAHPGNLRSIAGGVSNNPRTLWLRKKSFYNGLVLFAAFLAIAVLFFQIGKQRNPEGNEFRIAFLAPLSGNSSQLWYRQLKTAQLAVEKVNRQGGIRGYKLTIVGFDIPADPSSAAARVRKIMSDTSLLAMLTPLSGRTAEELCVLADRLEIPLLLSASEITKNVVTDDDGKPYLYAFRISNLPGEISRLMAYYAVHGLKAKKIALLCNENDRYSVEACDELRTWLRRYGRRVATDLSYSGNETDYTLALKTIKAGRADTLILPGNTKHISNLLSQAKTVDYNGNILGANFREEASSEPQEHAENSWWINRLAPNDPQVMSVLNDYRRLYNEQCPQNETENALLVYDSVLWIAAALFKAPGYRGEAVRHGLLSTRNLALTHATFTTDPRTHGPLDKACALIRASGGKGIFQKRISLKSNL